MRNFPLIVFFFSLLISFAHAQVLPGIDVLAERNFDIISGKRVGLVTNQTGKTRDGRATIDVLRAAPNVKLVALYAPEHGVRGEIAAGKSVKTYRDKSTGLPVYSLYGSTKSPTPAMLRGVDVLVFDIQDIGSRSYTFIATMGECMKACAAQKKPYVILDRPNPVGRRSEGKLAQKFSFVGPYPIPYRHGLTMGELAKWLNAKRGNTCRLSVVTMAGYQRDMTWRDTGLNWTPSSPNIPRGDSPFFYAATGILGELSGLSIGIGTSRPFELAGAPGLDANALAHTLNNRNIAGWDFKAVSWKPRGGRYAGKNCNGVQLILTDPSRADTTRINFEIWAATRRVAPRINFFPDSSHNRLFDLVCGTSTIRALMQKNVGIDRLLQVWNGDAAAWEKQSRAARLYG